MDDSLVVFGWTLGGAIAFGLDRPAVRGHCRLGQLVERPGQRHHPRPQDRRCPLAPVGTRAERGPARGVDRRCRWSAISWHHRPRGRVNRRLARRGSCRVVIAAVSDHAAVDRPRLWLRAAGAGHSSASPACHSPRVRLQYGRRPDGRRLSWRSPHRPRQRGGLVVGLVLALLLVRG